MPSFGILCLVQQLALQGCVNCHLSLPFMDNPKHFEELAKSEENITNGPNNSGLGNFKYYSFSAIWEWMCQVSTYEVNSPFCRIFSFWSTCSFNLCKAKPGFDWFCDSTLAARMPSCATFLQPLGNLSCGEQFVSIPGLHRHSSHFLMNWHKVGKSMITCRPHSESSHFLFQFWTTTIYSHFHWCSSNSCNWMTKSLGKQKGWHILLHRMLDSAKVFSACCWQH